MNELLGFLLLALGGLFLWIFSVEVYDALTTRIRRWRLRRSGELPSSWLDAVPPAEPGFHVGATSFHLRKSRSLLRRRHRRSLVLEPRGSAGFEAKWLRDP